VPLGLFLGAVEARLGDMTVGQLKKAVLGWARQLDPADRAAFFERLGTKLEAPRDRSVARAIAVSAPELNGYFDSTGGG
jgi:hypothetical protein